MQLRLAGAHGDSRACPQPLRDCSRTRPAARRRGVSLQADSQARVQRPSLHLHRSHSLSRPPRQLPRRPPLHRTPFAYRDCANTTALRSRRFCATTCQRRCALQRRQVPPCTHERELRTVLRNVVPARHAQAQSEHSPAVHAVQPLEGAHVPAAGGRHQRRIGELRSIGRRLRFVSPRLGKQCRLSPSLVGLDAQASVEV